MDTEDREYFRFLLRRGVNPKNALNIDTPLLSNVIRWEETEWVELLLEQGISINKINKRGETALVEAARYGMEDVIKMLIERGIDINAKDIDGNNALIHTSPKRLNICRILLDNGLDINAVNERGNNALDYADGYEHLKLLINYGIDVNHYGSYTVPYLYYKIEYLNYESIRLLVKSGTNIHLKNRCGRSLLYLSKGRADCYPVVILLLNWGADPDSWKHARKIQLICKQKVLAMGALGYDNLSILKNWNRDRIIK